MCGTRGRRGGGGHGGARARPGRPREGGASITETVRNKDAYLAGIPANLRTSPELADPAALAALDEVRGDLA